MHHALHRDIVLAGEAREERRAKAIRRQLVKDARRPSRKVQTEVDHGTRGLLRWTGWAVMFFFGGACYFALEERD